MSLFILKVYMNDLLIHLCFLFWEFPDLEVEGERRKRPNSFFFFFLGVLSTSKKRKKKKLT